MERFVLLRNDMETGPFTQDELIAQHLKTTDKIRAEGQNTTWQYAAEQEALRPFLQTYVSTPASQPKAWMAVTSNSIFVAWPPQAAMRPHVKGLCHDLAQSQTSTKKETQQHSVPTFSKSHTFLWAGCVVAGLLFSGILIKDLVAMYGIHAVKLAQVARQAHGSDGLDSAPETESYQNALITEIVPVDTLTKKQVFRQATKVNLNKLVQLEANDYRVGLLGGIKNLRMLVINKSAFLLEKVTFELQYLKSDGAVLKTEKLAVTSIAPKSSKSLAVPASSHSVKVAYHITGIQSDQNDGVMLNL